MTYTIIADSFGINLAPESEIEEILQNIKVILSTLKGTVPLDRNLGLSGEFIDRPTPIAENLITAEIIEAIEEYEPRAIVKNISFERNELIGKIIPKVEVMIDG